MDVIATHKMRNRRYPIGNHRRVNNHANSTSLSQVTVLVLAIGSAQSVPTKGQHSTQPVSVRSLEEIAATSTLATTFCAHVAAEGNLDLLNGRDLMAVTGVQPHAAIRL